MPVEHLASQASRGSTPLQQLAALQSLHTCIRGGRLTANSDLHLHEVNLGLPEGSVLEPEAAVLSPDRQRVVVPWSCRSTQAGGALVVGADWKTSGAAPSTRAPDPARRSFTRHQALSAHPVLACLVACSPCSRFCVSLTLRAMPESRHAFVAHVFRVRTQRWQAEVALHSGPGTDGASLRACSLQLSSDGDPLLAAALVGTRGQTALLVFDVAQPRTSLLVEAPGATSFLWLPGRARAVVLLRPGTVARLELSPLPAGPVELCWDALPSVPAEPAQPWMDLAPRSGVLWVLQPSEGGGSFSLSAFCAADLSVLSSCQREATGTPWFLHAASQAVAVCVGADTQVYALSGHTVGGLLFQAAALTGPVQFSADGRFLVGHRVDGEGQDRVQVLDVRSGQRLVNLGAKEFYVPAHGRIQLAFIEVVWVPSDPGALYVKASVKTSSLAEQNISGVVYVALRFWLR